MENRANRLSAELRKRAEDWIASRESDAKSAPVDVLRLVHELEVHEVELQMQNEDLRSARIEAESSRRRYSELFNSAPLGYLVLDDYIVQEANFEAARMLAAPRRELEGAVFNFFVGNKCRLEFSEFLRKAAVCRGDSPSETCEITLAVRGREPIDVRFVGRSISYDTDPRTLIAMLDVTARNRTEAAARLASDRLRSAVETAADGFALFDSARRLILCNAAYRQIFRDILPGDLVGRSFDELRTIWSDGACFQDGEARRLFREEVESKASQPTAAYEVAWRDGRTLRVIDRNTVEGGIVEAVWDLTEERHRAEELQHAQAAAEAASVAKTEFLSSMSHELRTPLNAILGFAQLLERDKKEPLSDRHRERLRNILEGGEHLLRLIDDVLDLSKIEAGGVSLTIEPLTLGDILAEVTRTLEPMSERQGIQLDVEPIGLEVPPIVADRTRFAQVLMNFGSNAIKYNRPSGTVKFSVSVPQKDLVRVTVRDTGMGIPLDRQEKLFQPFQRAGQEMGPIEGTGIGLVITKRLAQLMHGDVGFESIPGRGSAFWIDIPARRSSSRSGAPPAMQPGPSADQPHLG